MKKIGKTFYGFSDFQVSEMRLELTRAKAHYPLKVARLPIPPSGHLRFIGAKNGTRTRDPDLGKVVLYQLSYFRILFILSCYPETLFRFASAKLILFSESCKFFFKKIIRIRYSAFFYSSISGILTEGSLIVSVSAAFAVSSLRGKSSSRDTTDARCSLS